jgi:hypothetical protein
MVGSVERIPPQQPARSSSAHTPPQWTARSSSAHPHPQCPARSSSVHSPPQGLPMCYFAWDYTEMPRLGRELVEHRLPIKTGFRPYKQGARNFKPEIIERVKEEVDRLLQARFIQPCLYADWVSNIVPVEKNNTGKIRICVDFRNLNRATQKDEYALLIC